MGKIVISENVSLDGVGQDPTGDDGCTFGGWFHQMSAADRAGWAALEFREALDAQALLLGRRSYEYFATRWAPRPGEWADRLRTLPKYVVSSTLADCAWINTTVLTGDAIDSVAKLRSTLDGDIVVYGSGRLVRTLMENNLVDEVRLVLHPFVLGTGERLFGAMNSPTPLRRGDLRAVGDSLCLLTYHRIRAA